MSSRKNKKAFSIADTDMKFIDAYRQGLVDEEQAFDFVDKWHDTKTKLSVEEFLGITTEQYYYLAAHDRLPSDLKRNVGK